MGKRIRNINLKQIGNETLAIGYAGENEHTVVRFGCSSVYTDYPNAVVGLVIRPPQGSTYLATVTVEDSNVIWEVNAADAKYAGSGRYQLSFTDNGTEIFKSAIGSFTISDSIEPTGDAPDSLQNWMDQAEATAQEIAETAAQTAIEIAGDTQIAAIEAAGQDVLDSIPADYSALTEEVGNLSSAIPYQIENPYAMADEVEGYFNTDGSIHSQTVRKEKACLTYFPVKRGTPFWFRLFVKIPEGESVWNRLIRYEADKTAVGAWSNAPTLVGTTADGYSIYEYYEDGTSLSSSIAYMRYSYRSFGDAYVQFMSTYNTFPYTLNTKDILAKIDAVNQKVNEVGEPVYKFDKYNLRSIAHRGYTGNGEPENTFWSFKAAVSNGFPFIETDIAFTSDNVPVLLHDSTINRTGRNADGTEISTEININDITYAEACTYDFGIWKGAEYAGTKIPTLEDFLIFCRNTEVYPYFELKADVGTTQSNVTAVINMIKKYHMLDCVTFISFRADTFLQYAKNADGTVRLGTLINNSLANATSAIAYTNALKTGANRVFWDYSYTYFSAEESDIVASAITNGVELETWTLGNTTKVRDMNDFVTGVTSDGINFAELKRAKVLS